MTTHAANRSGRSLAEEAMGYIRRNSEKKFSLSEIAGSLYINRNYLARLFRKETGHTLLWYHNAVRCEKAGELLRQREMSISEIGEAVGYLSSAHFSHVFRKMTGLSPSEFRDNPSETCVAELRDIR